MVLWYEKYLGINFYYMRKEGKTYIEKNSMSFYKMQVWRAVLCTDLTIILTHVIRIIKKVVKYNYDFM
jgi:hypothetical protein